MIKTVKWGLGLMLLLGSLGGLTTVHAQTTVKSARHYNSRVIASRTAKRWAQPGSQAIGNTAKLQGNLVQLDQIAHTTKGTYFKVSRRGHHYGWLSATALKRTTRYVLPYTYTSQLYPLHAPNACEAASLKMALSVKGLATKTSLKTMIKRMPKAKTPTKGFTGNPYTESRPGETRTIYPAPLTNTPKLMMRQPVT